MNVRRSSGATEGRSALARRCSSYTVPFHPFQLRRVSFEDSHHGGASAVAQTSAFSFECGSRNAPPTLVYRFPRSGPSISARPSCGRVAPCILSRLFFFVNYLYTRLPGLRRPVFWDAGRRCFGSASETRRGPRVSFRAFVVCERVCRPLGCSVLEKMEARKDAATENWRSGLLEADVVRRGFAAAQGCRWNRTRVEIITPGELTFKCLS